MQGSNDKVRAAILAVAISLLTACGGGGSGSSGAPNPPGGIDLQVVSFGDSLSDVGTYAPIASAVGGGGSQPIRDKCGLRMLRNTTGTRLPRRSRSTSLMS